MVTLNVALTALRPRVIVAEPECGGNGALAPRLDATRFEVVPCHREQDLLEQILERRPGALVYFIAPQRASDLALLVLVRRMAPELPLILVARAASAEIQERMRSLHPACTV